MRNKQCLCGIYDDIRTTAKIVASYDYFCSDFILFFYFKPLLNDLLYNSFRQRVFSLKIRLHSKQELFDKDFLESSDVILFVEHEQSLLIVDGVNGSERNRAIAICY